QYAYDAASNETQRFCPMNGVAQFYERDPLGRVETLTLKKVAEPAFGTTAVPVKPPPVSAALSTPPPIGPTIGTPPLPVQVPLMPGLLVGLTNVLTAVTGAEVPPVGTNISAEHYSYDAMSRVTNVYRDEDGRNDSFGYDYSGQLTSASYGWNGRSVTNSQDKLGNRSQVNDNGSVQGYYRNPGYLNQYASAPTGPVSNGSEHEIAGYEGLNYSYIGDQRLAYINSSGNNYALGYDALGRCVWRNLNGTTIYYTYDGPHP